MATADTVAPLDTANEVQVNIEVGVTDYLLLCDRLSLTSL